jgi:predicted secreted protein
MTLLSGSMVFFVIWWVVLFMVLPFGIKTDETPPKGFEPGAPKNPQLLNKFLITTLLTGVVWSIIQVIMLNHLITFS